MVKSKYSGAESWHPPLPSHEVTQMPLPPSDSSATESVCCNVPPRINNNEAPKVVELGQFPQKNSLSTMSPYPREHRRRSRAQYSAASPSASILRSRILYVQQRKAAGKVLRPASGTLPAILTIADPDGPGSRTSRDYTPGPGQLTSRDKARTAQSAMNPILPKKRRPKGAALGSTTRSQIRTTFASGVVCLKISVGRSPRKNRSSNLRKSVSKKIFQIPLVSWRLSLRSKPPIKLSPEHYEERL